MQKRADSNGEGGEVEREVEREGGREGGREVVNKMACKAVDSRVNLHGWQRQ